MPSIDKMNIAGTLYTLDFLPCYYHTTATFDFNSVEAGKEGIHIIKSTNTNGPADTTTNHGILLTICSLGTPFQLWIPDILRVFYKRAQTLASYTDAGNHFTSTTWYKFTDESLLNNVGLTNTKYDEILNYYTSNNGKMDVKVWKYQQGDNSPGISDFSMAALTSAPGYHSTIDYTSTTSSWSGGEPWASVAADYYWCMYTQWVYMTAAVDIPATCTHDDAAAVFVNGVRIGYASSTTAFNVCFHLDQGWNKIQWLWYEHAGGAYCTTSINFAARSDCLYAVPEKKSFSAFID